MFRISKLARASFYEESVSWRHSEASLSNQWDSARWPREFAQPVGWLGKTLTEVFGTTIARAFVNAYVWNRLEAGMSSEVDAD